MSTIQLFPTKKKGVFTAASGDTFFHSRYDPEREAERFLSSELKSNTRTVILLGPGLGYLTEILKSTGICVICFCLDSFFVNYNNTAILWAPSSADTPLNFLQKNISELDISSLQLVSWTPICRFFSELHSHLMQVINDHIRILNGNIMTLNKFGRKWFSNFYRSILDGNDFFSLSVNPDSTIIIAASGPSLANSLEYINQYRDRFILVALPSSLCFLFNNGIAPDFIFLTDPGYFSSYHMHYSGSVPVIAPLTIFLPDHRSCRIPFLEDHFYEDEIELEIPIIPPTGTVAASALIFFSRYKNCRIGIAGMDFSHSHLMSHAHPHSFDTYFFSKNNRLEPIVSLLLNPVIETIYEKENQKTSAAYYTYYRWFNANILETDKIHRLFPSDFTLPIDSNWDRLLSDTKNLPEYQITPVDTSRTQPVLNDFTELISALSPLEPHSFYDTIRNNPSYNFLHELFISDILEMQTVNRKPNHHYTDKWLVFFDKIGVR